MLSLPLKTASRQSVTASWKDLNRFKMENELLERLMAERYAAMKAMSISLVDKEKKSYNVDRESASS